MSDFRRYVITSAELTTGKNAKGEILFVTDEIDSFTLENNGETIYVTGKNGVRLSAIDRNKTAKITVDNGVLTAGLLAAQTGSDLVTVTGELINVYDKQVTEDGLTVKSEYVAQGLLGAEILFIYDAEGNKYEQGADPDNEFAYDAATQTLTLPIDAGFAPGDTVIFTYKRLANGKKIVNESDKFAITCEIIVDVIVKDVCDNDKQYHAQVRLPKAKIENNFTIGASDQPQKHSFTAEALSLGCAVLKVLWELVIIED